MITWLKINFGTIVVSIILLIIIIKIIIKLRNDKKYGKLTCGCNCSSCALGGTCHKK